MVPLTLGIILITSVAIRDLPDYFVEWPQRGMTRFLYRADIHEVAAYLNDHPELENVRDYRFIGRSLGSRRSVY